MASVSYVSLYYFAGQCVFASLSRDVTSHLPAANSGMVGSATQTELRDRCSFPFRADLAGPHREQATRRIDVILLGEDCCLNEPLSEPRRAPSAGAVKWLPSARVLEHPIFHQHGCRTHPVVTCMHYKKFYDLLAKQSSTTQALRRIFATSVIRAEQSACLLLAHRQSYARKLLKPRQIHADVGECPAAAADGRVSGQCRSYTCQAGRILAFPDTKVWQDERSLVEHFCSETPVERPFSNTPSITVSDDMQGVRGDYWTSGCRWVTFPCTFLHLCTRLKTSGVQPLLCRKTPTDRQIQGLECQHPASTTLSAGAVLVKR